MTYQSIAFFVLVAWCIIGFALGVVMQRRGYSGFGWGVVGLVLGPIGLLLALFAHTAPRVDERMAAGEAGAGTVDVLVGVDGSTTALSAAVAAANTLGARVRRFTLAYVEPRDATPSEDTGAHEILEAAATATLPGLQSVGVRPGAVVLHGPPAEALTRHAVDDGYEILCVGSRGRGASKALLGSAAAALVRSATVPILLVGGSGHASRSVRRPVARSAV